MKNLANNTRSEERFATRHEYLNKLCDAIETEISIFDNELYVYRNMITGFGFTGQAIKMDTGNLEML
jgi:hypothetical protein